MKYKGGNVYGSIYERKRKNCGISYTAEIQFQGQTMRRTSKDKAKLEEWKDSICNKLNSVLDRYNAELGEQLAIVCIMPREYKENGLDCPMKKWTELLKLSGSRPRGHFF